MIDPAGGFEYFETRQVAEMVAKRRATQFVVTHEVWHMERVLIADPMDGR